MINHSNNENLLGRRIQEQRKREAKKTRRSRLQSVIVKVCASNPPSYSASINQIYDSYHGTRSGDDRSKKVAIWKSIRNLVEKEVVKPLKGRKSRVYLSEKMISYLKETLSKED